MCGYKTKLKVFRGVSLSFKWESVYVQFLSRVQLFMTPWTIARQAPLSMRFSQRVLEQVAISSPGDHPRLGIEPASPVSPALAGRFFSIVPTGKP